MSGAVFALVDLSPLKKSLDSAKEAAIKLYEIIDEVRNNYSHVTGHVTYLS